MFDFLQDRQGDITEDETIKFKSYLLSLGIDDPVTRDGYKTESQFHKNLAQQISIFLVEPITVSFAGLFSFIYLFINYKLYLTAEYFYSFNYCLF